MNETALKMPPHSVESEQSVLGGLMLSQQAWDEIVSLVGEQDFYRADHRAIFAAIAQLAGMREPCDVVTVSNQLRAMGKLEEAGGLAQLSQLAKDTPSAANIRAYARIVREKAMRRELIRAATEIQSAAYDGSIEVAEQMQQAERAICGISEQRDQGGPELVSGSLKAFVDDLEARRELDSDVTGLPTGYSSLDHMTGGLHDGDLIIIAGRPSMGKSSIALQIAEHCGVHLKRPAAVFSLEMPKQQLIARHISSIARIPLEQLRSPRKLMEFSKVTSGVAALADAPIYLDDRAGLTVHEIASRARRIHRRQRLSLIVVDYLQIMRAKAENRTLEIAEMTMGLKAIAKELQVPVVALSQLNRGVEDRPDKRPRMSDLRDGGSIEQDADLILFLYRDDYYHQNSPHAGITEVNIAKQRNGPTGTIDLTWIPNLCRLENYVGPPRAVREHQAAPAAGERKPRKGLSAPHEPIFQ